jgi:MoaA/NifB/PqqE/SkfB family radical SAM enzyme
MKQEIIRITSSCNQKCLFCNQEEYIKTKTKKQILLELLNFKKDNISYLIISWWEPTLCKEELFFTIITWKKLWFKYIELQSNAVLLSNLEYVKELKQKWLNWAMISLHSFESVVSDYLTQAPSTFNKTILWIKNLIELWIETTINIVINKKNYNKVLDYVIFVKDNFKWFKQLSLSIVVPWKSTKENNLLPEYSEISKYLIEAYDYCIKNKIHFENPWCWIPVCYIKDYYKYSLEYQNYKEWNKYNELVLEKNKRNKIKSEKCTNCIFDNYCLWLWKWYIDVHWFNDLNPIIKL